MNRTLQVQLAFVAISLLVLVLVAFFPPALRVSEVQFEQASREADRAARAEARRQRQREVEAGHATPDSPGGGRDSGQAQADKDAAAATEDPRGGAGQAPVASDPTPPQPTRGRMRAATPRATPASESMDDLPADAGDPANETIF